MEINYSFLGLIFASITFIVPLSYILFNYFIDNIYKSTSISKQWNEARSQFEVYVSFADNLVTELFLNCIWFIFYYLFLNGNTYSEITLWLFAIGVLVFKIILNYLRDFNLAYKIISSICKKGKPIEIFFLLMSLILHFSVFISHFAVLPAIFPWVLQARFEILVVAIIALHLFTWIFLIEVWRPGYYLIKAKTNMIDE